MKKYIALLYFLGLFLIMASYLLFSTPDTSLRISVSCSDFLSTSQPNFMSVIVRDLKTGSHFKNQTLKACWLDSGSAELSCTRQKLAENGQMAMPMPPMPQSPFEALTVTLLNDNGKPRKTATVPQNRFIIQNSETEPESDTAAPPPGNDAFFAFAPAAFLSNIDNELFIITIHHGRPVKDSVALSQIYGQPADFPNAVKPSIFGIARTHMRIGQSPVDIQMEQNGRKFYATFLPNDSALHATLNQTNATPEITVTPLGRMPKLYLDFFSGNAWIGRRTLIPPNHTNTAIPLSDIPPATPQPGIVFARISASAIATPRSSQTFAIIRPPNPLTPCEQAQFVLQRARPFPESDAWLDAIASATTQECADLRDYLLAKAASTHHVAIQTKLRTETEDEARFINQKNAHRAFANRLLIAWIFSGIALLSALAALETYDRKRAWTALSQTGANANDKPPIHRHIFNFICILLLLSGIAGLLFYMMQIV